MVGNLAFNVPLKSATVDDPEGLEHKQHFKEDSIAPASHGKQAWPEEVREQSSRGGARWNIRSGARIRAHWWEERDLIPPLHMVSMTRGSHQQSSWGGIRCKGSHHKEGDKDNRWEGRDLISSASHGKHGRGSHYIQWQDQMERESP